ncbi:MAG: D-2-hydroxyacid dehydrogenase [Bacteroidaceae bacterium]|nr:D-2-hydroxyacid dehydrogenase [Bacteroidaceae bacterium]
MKIVVLDGYAGNPGDMSWKELNALGECIIYDRTTPEEMIERAKDADIVLTNKVCFQAKHFDQLPQLKYVGVIATGYNIIDCEAARAHGVTVTNIPAYSTNSVAQMAFAHILNIYNRVDHYATEIREQDAWVKSQDFSFLDTPLFELYGKKIGIVGLGNTGMATARIAIGFGMEVYAFTSKSEFQLPHEIKKMELDDLFRECDIISLHCPLTPTTKDLVNARRLKLMKPTSIIINTSRGPVVNAQDLADALNSGRIMAAGVDVLETEPPTADNPLLKAKNCYITPHIAWASFEARVRLMDILVSNVKAFIEGNPINVVN